MGANSLFHVFSELWTYALLERFQLLILRTAGYSVESDYARLTQCAMLPIYFLTPSEVEALEALISSRIMNRLLTEESDRKFGRW